MNETKYIYPLWWLNCLIDLLVLGLFGGVIEWLTENEISRWIILPVIVLIVCSFAIALILPWAIFSKEVPK